ncbi:MAG TPA: histidine kinase dimerization/phosphoacceptor domain -containing protein [Candidatus Paceibacterota bacterium]|jgi:chemotaxis protein methyltransferase CheR|nr:histidine kinase dimerization/phosphoacceptor domain -containing protein [Candidatus Paceibacterota bacterium]
MITHLVGDDPFANTELGNALTRAIVDTIHEPFLVLDADLRIIVASRSFYEKFKVSKEDTQGELLYEIGNGQYDIPALRHFLKNIIPEHAVMKEYKIVHNFLNIGKRTMFLSAREVVYENSQRKHVLLTMGDVTGQELLDEEKEKLSNEKDLMIREMKHRMANSLQLIASILILKSEVVESPEVRTHLKDAHERIMSIATVEKFLDTTSLNEEVEVGPYLTGLCESLSASMIGSNKPITLTIEAGSGLVTSSVGISLGLITAELVMNCLKHAFPNGKHGSIVVTYNAHKDGWELAVKDDGVGVSVNPLRKEGLGTTIVQSLARQLGAEVHMTTGSHGTAVSIHSVPQKVLKQ